MYMHSDKKIVVMEISTNQESVIGARHAEIYLRIFLKGQKI